MKKETEKIEIPFGAKDSELYKFEYSIPEGYEAEIKDGKVIVKKKESEDEKIRKEIIEFIDWAGSRGSVRNDWHQKKRPAEWIAYLEKQKEQKPVEIDEYKIIKKHITEDSLSSEVNKRLKECGWYVTYEKPAEWSEEDEKMLDNTLDSLKRYQLSMPNFQVELQMRWLKSLRPQPKQKSHLGMKDQWCCSAAWAAVRDSDAYNGEEKQFILNFLQRCKPQPHWKPSEEQMAILRAVLNDNNNITSESANITLESLYNDLKKLL